MSAAASSRAGKKGAASAGTKKSKKADAVAPPPADELDALNTEQLAELWKLEQAKLNEARRNRNYYQLEAEQVRGFYAIVADEASRTESHLRNIASQMERMQDTHRNDIRIYLQKVIHLEYEHANNVERVGEQASSAQADALAQHDASKRELQELKLQLKGALHKSEVSHEEEIRRLKEVERKEMQKLREQFERNYAELLAAYETRLASLRDDLQLRTKMELHEIEERKNRHINDLMLHHASHFGAMRTYYNAITQDNLDLIRELNAEIEDLKAAHVANERAMEAIEKKNASLAEPLAQAEKRVAALQHKLANYAKDKQSLRHARARLGVLEESYKALQERHARLQSEYASVESERARLYAEFESTVGGVARRSAGANEQLESLLEKYGELFDIKKTQFASVLRASNLDPLVLASVTQKLDDVLSAKNEQLESLTYERAKLTKAHNEIVRVYEAKLRKLGVPEDQVHLQPLIQTGQYHMAGTGTAPADLIVQ